MKDDKLALLLQDFYIYFSGWMRQQFKRVKGKELTFTQYKVLFIIKNLESCKMSELSDIAEVSKGTMTIMLNKLVEEGYVNRTSSLTDRRNIYVELTNKGVLEVNEMHNRFLNSIGEAMVESLREDEYHQIKEALAMLNDVFKGRK